VNDARGNQLFGGYRKALVGRQAKRYYLKGMILPGRNGNNTQNAFNERHFWAVGKVN
jgi:hypothetical protein